jgi:DNA polymerase-1
VSEDEARSFIDTYDREMPFVKDLLASVGKVAEQRGWIKTILGRRARFELFEERGGGYGALCLPYDKAVEKWGKHRIIRAGTYKALNRLIQGSAADIFKKALSDIWKSGVCDVLGCPLNLVHDEVCWSVPRAQAAKEAHDHSLELMRNAVKLSVPLLVDSECGPSWGAVK